MSELKVNKVTPRSGTTITIGDSGEHLALAGNIGLGGATPTTSGTGITFPATASPSTNANTLDDYEEGTWTASFSGGTHTQTGGYTKIGNQVYVLVFGRGITTASAVSATISGLPFTSKNDSNYYSAGTITYNSYATNSDGGNGFFYTNNTVFQLVQVDSQSDATSTIGSGKEIMMSGFYTTDS
jgi:hypothetical protein